MHYTFLINPAAHGGRAARLAAVLPSWAAAAGLDARVETAASAGVLAAHARAAADAGRCPVAVGGDGTIHTLVRGLAAGGVVPPFGIVPCGTGNDFAKMTGTPRRPRAAVEALRGGEVRWFDYGIVRWTGADGAGERPFVNAVGVGFDAWVAAAVGRYRHLPGAAAYLAAVAAALRRLRPTDACVLAGTCVLHDGPLLLATVGNGRSSGGHFRLTPLARADDGLLDVCAIGAASLWRLLPLVPRVLTGRHLCTPLVEAAQAAAVTVALQRPLPLHADGEGLAAAARTVVVEVVRGGLPVVGGAAGRGFQRSSVEERHGSAGPVVS